MVFMPNITTNHAITYTNLFWVWKIMYANELKTKEKQKLNEVKN